MSVPVARRTPGKLKVETVCFELCNTTRKLLCNEKLFPKRSHWLGGARHIADAASLMMLFIFTANDIKVKTPKEARDRHELQTLAIALHGALEKRMTFEAFYWETNPNLYSVWADLMNQEGRLLRNWMYKDEQRYADLSIKPYATGAALKKMDAFYTELFKEKPIYKYKRRKHRHVQRRKSAAPR